jgi:acetyl-CoA C-acetyltransferase
VKNLIESIGWKTEILRLLLQNDITTQSRWGEGRVRGKGKYMNDAFIVSAARLPIGRFGGALKDVSDWDLGTIVIAEALKRAGLRGDKIDEVIMAHGFRTGDLPANSSRAVALRAGIPIEIPQFTINKACGGSLRAVSLAAQIIRSGESDIIVAGGMESMSRAAYILPKVRWGSRLGNAQLIDQLVLLDPISGYSLGETGENVAELYKISREDQDGFALASQQKAEHAIKSNRFKEEIVAVPIPQGRGGPSVFDTDEHPRFGTTLEALSQLKPAFKKNGTITAGNASGLNDGASAAVVMSRRKVKELGIHPLVSIRSYASIGVKPEIMGIGPIPATKKALERSGLALKEIDLIELNEAFAAQSLAVIRELGMDMERVNVNGGAIALGHPISATGCILLTKIIYEMKRRKSKFGLVAMCIAGGQGIAMIVENEPS